jgi:hypothetical protein
MTAKYYYEAHVTLDPVGERRAEVEEIAGHQRFRLAKLLMDKGVPSQLDTFMTGHDHDLESMRSRVAQTVKALQRAGFVVRRYKIEDTVLDSRIKDELELL